MTIAFYASNNRLVRSRELKWVNNRSFVAHGPNFKWCLAPKMRNITALDAGRSWSGATQNVNVIFSEAMSGNATGWSATVNGSSVGVSYVSGSGTQAWVMQLATTLHHGDTFKISYDIATGATISTSGSVEINAVNAVQQPDGLSRRIRFILCDSTSTLATPVPVASESVKAALLEYDGGVVDDPPERLWMFRANAATVTTDADGQFDMEYTGVAAVGETVYAAVIRSGGQNVIGTRMVV